MFAARASTNTKLPSMVLVFFALGGGTGSGIVVDLARHSVQRQARAADPRHRRRRRCRSPATPSTTAAPACSRSMNELDCMLDDAKNQGVIAVWGDLYKNPFTGGFLALPQEHSWQRLHRYTDAGRKETRKSLSVRVTNKFVDDSFVPLRRAGLRPRAVQGAASGRLHRRAARAQSPTATATGRYSTCAKYSHPGVEVLPGEPMSKWRDVDRQVDRVHPEVLGPQGGLQDRLHRGPHRIGAVALERHAADEAGGHPAAVPARRATTAP